MKLLKNPYSPLLLSLSLLGTACLPTNRSSTPNVINGDTSTEFSPTVMLKITKGDLIEYCSGVFIQDNILLTSGLCLEGAKEVAVSSFTEPFKSKPVRSTSFKKHEKFTSKKAEVTTDGKPTSFNYVPTESVFADVGIVTFPKGTAPSSMIAKVATTAPSRGDVVYLAGYGAKNDAGEGRGTFRVGKNKIDVISDDEYKTLSVRNERDSNGAIMGSGDAGAPLYNSAKEVIGVTSVKQNSKSTGYYANIQVSATNSFIKEYLKSGTSSGGTVGGSSSGGSSAFNVRSSCESDVLTIRFADSGTEKLVVVPGCKTAKIACVRETSLELTSGSSTASRLISSKENCEKIRDAISGKI